MTRLQDGYELRGVPMDDEVAMETVEATQPTVAMKPVNGTEPCAHCGAPLARDQRYCLECGTPRTYLSGILLERLQESSKQTPSLPPAQLPPSSTWQRGNVLTLIAGIGVLLLAMGVGVLIGRSGDSGSASSPAPQVISLGGVGAAGAAGASTTPTATPEAATTPTTTSGSGSSTTKPKAKALTPGVGSVPSKPAPPSVLKNLRKKSNGESFEQKSKNLPNVVETG